MRLLFPSQTYVHTHTHMDKTNCKYRYTCTLTCIKRKKKIVPPKLIHVGLATFLVAKRGGTLALPNLIHYLVSVVMTEAVGGGAVDTEVTFIAYQSVLI